MRELTILEKASKNFTHNIISTLDLKKYAKCYRWEFKTLNNSRLMITLHGKLKHDSHSKKRTWYFLRYKNELALEDGYTMKELKQCYIESLASEYAEIKLIEA